jgi:hypothetical protein
MPFKITVALSCNSRLVTVIHTDTSHITNSELKYKRMIRDKEGNDLTKQQPVLLYPLKDV